MAIVRAIVTFMGRTGDPKDRFVNTWHADVDDPTEGSTDVLEFFNRLKDFYGLDTEQASNQQPAGERNILDYFGDHIINAQQHTMRFYDLNDPEPRHPVLSGTFNKNDSGQEKLPAEVAVVLSLRGEVGQGQNVQRGRGRIYLGPLNHRAMSSDDNDARVSANFRNVIGKAYLRLHDAMGAVGGIVVYSHGARAIDPATGKRKTGALLPAAAFGANHAHIDDAFDTQRRRGLKSTARTLVLGG